MPSLFSRFKQPISKSTISRPVLVEAPTIADYQGETPLMQIPRTTPPPPPPVPRFELLRREPRGCRATTVTQIVDLYEQPVDRKDIDPYIHDRLSSLTSSLSSGEWDSDKMSSSSQSASSLPSTKKDDADSENEVATDDLTRTTQRSPFPAGTAHAPIPFTLPNTDHAVRTHQVHLQKRLPPPPPKPLPPIPRTDALGRGLAQHYITTSLPSQRPVHAAATFTPQPSNTRTRTDTRSQGRWLGLGTTRVDPKQLRQQAKEAVKMRERVEKEARKVERQMAREALKAEKI